MSKEDDELVFEDNYRDRLKVLHGHDGNFFLNVNNGQSVQLCPTDAKKLRKFLKVKK